MVTPIIQERTEFRSRSLLEITHEIKFEPKCQSIIPAIVTNLFQVMLKFEDYTSSPIKQKIFQEFEKLKNELLNFKPNYKELTDYVFQVLYYIIDNNNANFQARYSSIFKYFMQKDFSESCILTIMCFIKDKLSQETSDMLLSGSIYLENAYEVFDLFSILFDVNIIILHETEQIVEKNNKSFIPRLFFYLKNDGDTSILYTKEMIDIESQPSLINYYSSQLLSQNNFGYPSLTIVNHYNQPSLDEGPNNFNPTLLPVNNNDQTFPYDDGEEPPPALINYEFLMPVPAYPIVKSSSYNNIPNIPPPFNQMNNVPQFQRPLSYSAPLGIQAPPPPPPPPIASHYIPPRLDQAPKPNLVPAQVPAPALNVNSWPDHHSVEYKFPASTGSQNKPAIMAPAQSVPAEIVKYLQSLGQVLKQYGVYDEDLRAQTNKILEMFPEIGIAFRDTVLSIPKVNRPLPKLPVEVSLLEKNKNYSGFGGAPVLHKPGSIPVETQKNELNHMPQPAIPPRKSPNTNFNVERGGYTWPNNIHESRNLEILNPYQYYNTFNYNHIAAREDQAIVCDFHRDPIHKDYFDQDIKCPNQCKICNNCRISNLYCCVLCERVYGDREKQILEVLKLSSA